jgi:hypothetical protein
MLNAVVTGGTPVYLLPVGPQMCPGGRDLSIALPGNDRQKMPVWAESEVARWRSQQQLEEESARLGLSGPAILASHDCILAKIEQGGSHLLQLFQQGRNEEAFDLWNAGILE